MTNDGHAGCSYERVLTNKLLILEDGVSHLRMKGGTFSYLFELYVEFQVSNSRIVVLLLSRVCFPWYSGLFPSLPIHIITSSQILTQEMKPNQYKTRNKNAQHVLLYKQPSYAFLVY